MHHDYRNMETIVHDKMHTVIDKTLQHAYNTPYSFWAWKYYLYFENDLDKLKRNLYNTAPGVISSFGDVFIKPKNGEKD